jgi:circadian clock protein KaiB
MGSFHASRLLPPKMRWLGEWVESENPYMLKLFVAGSSNGAGRAIVNLKRLCEEDLFGRYQLVVIDVLRQPEIAEQEKVLATPTLIKSAPPPLSRIIGDLSNRQNLLAGMGLLS